jgi:hypothetical protein
MVWEWFALHFSNATCYTTSRKFTAELIFSESTIMTPSSTSQDDRAWAARLQRWGLDDIAPVFIEVLRPLGTIGGQLLTLTSPLLTTFMTEDRLDRLVEMLDDPDRLDQFLRSLDHEAEQ